MCAGHNTVGIEGIRMDASWDQAGRGVPRGRRRWAARRRVTELLTILGAAAAGSGADARAPRLAGATREDSDCAER